MKLVLAILATLNLTIVIVILGSVFIACVRDGVKNSVFAGLALIIPLLATILLLWVLYLQG